jgi:hypothetical protein
MAEAALLVRSFRVGKRTCTLTIPTPRPGGTASLVAEWSPNIPNRPFTKKEERQYFAGRHAVMTELAAQIGGSILIIDT